MSLSGSKTFKTIRSMWPAFLGICAVAGLVGFGLVYWLAQRPPVIVHGIKEVDGVAVTNGAIDLLALDVTRSRSCDVRVDRWLWQDTSMRDRLGRVIRKYVPLVSAPPPPTPLGEPTTFVLSLPLPSNVEPGEWYYWSRLFDRCGLVPALDTPSRESTDHLVVVKPYAPAPTPPALELFLAVPPPPGAGAP